MTPERRALTMAIQSLEHIAFFARKAAEKAEQALERARNQYAFLYGLYPLAGDAIKKTPKRTSKKKKAAK